MSAQLSCNTWKQGYQTIFQQEDHGTRYVNHMDMIHIIVQWCKNIRQYPRVHIANFSKLVGHDDKDCRTMELMRERTLDIYRVQEEMGTGKNTPQFN